MIVTSPIRSLGGLLMDHNKNDSRKQIGSLLQSVTLVPLQLPPWSGAVSVEWLSAVGVWSTAHKNVCCSVA